MRFPLQLTVAATLSFAVGLCGTYWIAQPERKEIRPAMLEGRTSPDPANVVPVFSGSATAKETIAALTALLEQPLSMARDHAITAALLKLEAADFPGTASEMLDLLTQSQKPFEIQRGELAEAWMDRWLEIDKQGALRFLSETPFLAELTNPDLLGWPLEEQSHFGLGGVFKALARRDRDWTRKTLSETKDPKKRELGLYALLREAARNDPAKAKQLLASFTDGKDRRAVLIGYVTGLVNTDMQTCFDMAWKEPAGWVREEALRIIFFQAGSRGISHVRELLDRIDDPGARPRHAATALGMIAEERREDAFSFVKEESERMSASGAKIDNFREWAGAVQWAARGSQALAFAEWAAGFAPDTSREMFNSIVISWAESDPAGLQNWLSSHAGTLDKTAVKIVFGALSNMARNDLEATRRWADTLPPGTLRDQARVQVALASRSQGDLVYASAAYKSVASTDAGGALARQLAGVLAVQDGAAAAEWATQLPAGPAREAALLTVANSWFGRDLAGAAQWLLGRPAGTERDRLMGTYASIVAVADSSAAGQWVEQVADPALRAEATRTVFTRWNMENPVAARAWLRSLQGVDARTVASYLRDVR